MNNWTCTKSRTDLNLCLTSGVEVDLDPGKKYLRDRGPSLNQYCLLRDFKCPQIKLISIIQKPITTNTTYLPWYTVCIACLHYWSASLNQHSTLSHRHQTASIKPLHKCGPYMPMAVLIRASCRRLASAYKNVDSWRNKQRRRGKISVNWHIGIH